MSWFSAWLPELPTLNLALPTSIQGRFLSFVLKRTLGHFLKPGQLDARQIDSQIGSGFVQVNDLELDSGAINTLLSGLPLYFSSGTLSSATVRIPWPNPLTSTLGFSLKSLHLVFELSPTPTASSPDIDLASSVASVAETFFHEELTPREEASLMGSLHSDVPGAFNVDKGDVPGGLDPFDVENEEEPRSETEPGGISLFATLIERLLSRFEFDAQDIRITIIHPDNVDVTFSLSEVRYNTNIKQPDAPPSSADGRTSSVTRSLTANGITLQMKDLRKSAVHLPGSPMASHPSISSTILDPPHRVHPSESPSSSSSSLDEETTMAMSQSLATLPPRVPSLSQSMDSTMYQSALSVVNEDHEPTEPHSPPVTDHSGNPQLSLVPLDKLVFSSGSSPITVTVVTTPPTNVEGRSSDQRDKLTFSLQTGLFACALRPWHIRGLLSLTDAIISKLPKSKSQSTRQTATSGLAVFDVEASLDLRGIAILLLPSGSLSVVDDLERFFLHPLISPSLSSGYLRLYVETINASLRLPPQPEAPPNQSTQTTSRPSDHLLMRGLFSIHNVSLFVFRSGNGDEISAFPILFTDPYLTTQYTLSHRHPSEQDGSLDIPLPEFDVLDWTARDQQKRGAARLSYWRCKPKTRQQTRRRPQDRSIIVSPPSHMAGLPGCPPEELAFSVTFERTQKPKQSTELIVEGKIAPLHILVDLDTLVGDDVVMKFMEEATQGFGPASGPISEDADRLDYFGGDDTPLAGERRRLERLVLDDLDLEYDYGDTRTRGQHRDVSQKFREEIHLSLGLAALRLEIRVPSLRDVPSSGALVIDFRTVELRNGPRKVDNHPRFATPLDEPSPVPVFSVECERILIAHSLVNQSLATALLSLGPLSDGDGLDPSGLYVPLRPRVSVTKSQASSGVITVLNVELPSAHVVITKELLDGLQYFIDDASQLFERFSQRTTKTEGEGRESGDNSLIGSRFFAKSRSNSASALMSSTSSSGSETVVKLAISEAFLRAWVPRTDAEPTSIRPFDVFASETSVLIEPKPEGKEETVITLGILDAKIVNAFKSGKSETILALTAPRGLTSTPRPLVKLRFISLTVPGTMAKETRLKLTLSDFTCNMFPDIDWAKDLGLFAKSPPGTFESVIPNERTNIVLKIMDGSIRAYAPTKPGAIVLYVGDMDLTTDITGNSLESTVALGIQYLSVLTIDDVDAHVDEVAMHELKGVPYWKSSGYALVAEVAETKTTVTVTKNTPVHVELNVDGIRLHLHLAADTLSALSVLIADIASTFSPPEEEVPQVTREPVILSETNASRNLMDSVEDIAFQRPPEIGPAPDLICDDLPTNADYLDESFGAAAGLREFSDDELDDLGDDVGGEYEVKDILFTQVEPGGVSNHYGETIKVNAEGINMIEEYYDNLPVELTESPVGGIESKLKIRVRGGDATLFLYDGYDWVRTRKVIEEEVKEMRRRLAKIRQLVASGQVHESDMEETNAVLFNSVYIGIDQDVDMTEPGALLAAIDEELKDDVETATQSSWQSLRATGAPVAGGGKQRTRATRAHSKKLTRAKGPSMEFKLMGLNADVDQFHPDEIVVSKTFATIRDVEILDHIKTSTWKKFLTALRSDSRGNIRETDSEMVRIELRGVRPAPGHPSEESRLRAKILPLRLYVDQDAVDFLKKFFSFKDPHQVPVETEKSSPEAYIQLAEIFPVDLKLDYKPRRVDYRALREGRTIELMNFFHFDGAEMTLRHITLAGITGWPRMFEMLNDLWTPDVKATQLVDVISGVAPIRSMVNVGSGVADLVLLPISQYKKDGRIVRGMQKGATAFVKSTAIEAIKMGARLATGTQVILEQAESVLGGQFTDSYTTEAVQVPTLDENGRLTLDMDEEEDAGSDLISKYAEQPMNVREGFESAYRSLRRNFNSAAQTILAVPMEVYERSGNEGPVRSVIRAVPIAVLKPMIGASEAISKTLLGLHNTLDPNVRRENEAKYKHR